MTLYELTDQFMQLLEMIEDLEVDPDVLLDTMDAVELDINDKADAYAKIISMVTADIEAVDVEAKRLAARKAAMASNLLKLKTNLQDTLEKTGKTKFKTALFSFNVQNNPPSVVMEVTDFEQVPEHYLRYRDPEIDKKKILEDLKNGIDLPGLAHLERTRSLRIR